MFGFTEPTAYDLKFHIFQTPVRVHPLFWLIAVILGMDSRDAGGVLGPLVLWVAAVFVSILVHEFGHVFAARFCGWRVEEVVLHQWGGHASMIPPYGPRWAINDIFISLAGPFAGFGIALFIILSELYFPKLLEGFGKAGDEFWNYMLVINIGWGIFNLLPIYPLDGGQATRSFLMALAHGGGDAAAIISIVTAAVVGIFMLKSGSIWMGILMFSLVLTNMQMIGSRR